jgi:hypothetical protein
MQVLYVKFQAVPAYQKVPPAGALPVAVSRSARPGAADANGAFTNCAADEATAPSVRGAQVQPNPPSGSAGPSKCTTRR